MKKEYDFSKADQGRFHRDESELRVPIYLDGDVETKLLKGSRRGRDDLSRLVNSVLRKEFELSKLLDEAG